MLLIDIRFYTITTEFSAALKMPNLNNPQGTQCRVMKCPSYPAYRGDPALGSYERISHMKY